MFRNSTWECCRCATTAEAPTTAAAMANQPIAFLARMEYSDLKTLTASNKNISSIFDLKGKNWFYSWYRVKFIQSNF